MKCSTVTRQGKRFLVILLTLSLLLTTVSVALAAPKGKVSPGLGSRFRDWDENYWADEYLSRMILKGVVRGAGDQILPENKITNQEAATMLIRLLGLSKEADEDEFDLEFDDAAKLPNWARGAVALALRNGYMDLYNRHFDPEHKLTRLEAAIILVKAAKLDAEAKAQMDAVLPFRDASAIPRSAVGYVAVAIEKGFIVGYNDRTFRPNQPITRAEWAKLLDLLDRKLDLTKDRYQVKGTVRAIDLGRPSVSLLTPVYTVDPGKTYYFDDAAVFYINGREATLADIRVGDEVIIQLSPEPDLKILMLTVISKTTEVRGTVTVITTAQGTVPASLTLSSSDNTLTTYSVASDAFIQLGGAPATLSEVRVGDRVRLTLERNVVTRIMVEVNPQSYEGTVVGVNLGSNTEKPAVKINAAGQEKTFEVADYATIISAANSEITLADIKVGDEVQLTVQRQLVIRIKVKRTTVQSQVEGTIAMAVAATTTQPAFLVLRLSAGAQETVLLAPNVTVRYGTQTLTFNDLLVGDQVKVIKVNNRGTSVEIQVRSGQAQGTTTGQIVSLDLANQRFTIRTNNPPGGTSSSTGTVEVVIYYNQSTVFVYQGNVLQPSNLAVGQQVTIRGTLAGDKYTANRVEVTQLTGS